MIRNVLLDADDTLFDFHLSEREALAAALRSFGVEPTPQMIRRYSEINGECWKMCASRHQSDEGSVRMYCLDNFSFTIVCFTGIATIHRLLNAFDSKD